MNSPSQTSARIISTAITRVVLGMAVAWTVITGGLFILNAWHHKQSVEQTAIEQARMHFNKDLAFRAWATAHGGVYVPVTEETPPNPYLSQIPERDLETPSGRKLTLMNPAYIIRQLFAKSREAYGITEHITSLQPLSPANTPDAWEKKALTAFAQGKTEVIEFLDFDGAPHLRLMQPLITREGCLKCHAEHGYRLGDVRGGISIALPMNAMLVHEHRFSLITSLTLGLVWLLGLGSLLLGRHLLMRRIGERNQAVEALEQSQAHHGEAQRLARLGHWEQDLVTNRLQWSEEVFRIFAKEPRTFKVSFEAFLEAVHPEDRELVTQAFSSSVHNRTPYDLVHRLLMADGSIKFVHERCETVYDPSGEPLRSLGTIQDITEHKQALLALRASEERLQLVLHAANLGMWDWDVPTGALEINERWAEILGYRKEEIEPHVSSWEKLVHPDDKSSVLPALQDHLDGRTAFFQTEYRLRAKSGEWKWIHDAGQVVSRDAAGRPIRAVGIHYDITANKQLEQRVLQQERLSAVGQLTAGIAHDFNNTLTSILGFAELLHSSPEIPEAARKDLAVIISSGQRAAYLIRQMLDFSRKSLRHLRRLDLVPLVKEVVKFLQSAIPESIHIQLEIVPGDYLVQADPAQIQQVLTNLVLNAKDAMSSGGELLVGLSRVVLAGEEQCVTCDQPLVGVWASLTVTDTGSGIAPENLSRIFEPFFTTKEVGMGSGLGLAQVHGIVKQHGGHIAVQSRLDRGTTFTVYLPLVLLPVVEEESGDATQVCYGRNETLLVVEDELTVLAVMETMLQDLGYQVLTATNGREALEVYAQHQEAIALVLSDMVMPNMDGATLFAALKAQHPGVKVIFMSGYPLQGQEAELLEQGIISWFQKPPTRQSLSQIIRNALDGQ